MIDERYAAGFFDGEGCIHVDRNVRVILAGCFTPGLLDRFAQRWGGHVTRASWSNRSRRPGARWEIVGGMAHAFLTDLLPHLIEKQEQARLALAYRELKISFNVRGGKGYNESQKQAILAIEQQMRHAKRPVHVYSWA